MLSVSGSVWTGPEVPVSSPLAARPVPLRREGRVRLCPLEMEPGPVSGKLGPTAPSAGQGDTQVPAEGRAKPVF